MWQAVVFKALHGKAWLVAMPICAAHLVLVTASGGGCLWVCFRRIGGGCEKRGMADKVLMLGFPV
jgi:hypothetical protein